MQLIGTETGRASLLVAWEEIRPLTAIPTIMLMQAAVERYKVQYPPALPRTYAEYTSSVTELRCGSLEHEGRLISIQGIFIYSDAIGIECSITDDADIVLNDMMEWSRTLGFRELIRPHQKLYISRVIVKFDVQLESLFGRWREIESLLAGSAEKRYGEISPFGLMQVQFRSDIRKVINANLVSQFIFERRYNESYSENRYMCQAPLTTAEHLTLLERLELLATASN